MTGGTVAEAAVAGGFGAGVAGGKGHDVPYCAIVPYVTFVAFVALDPFLLLGNHF